MADVEVPSWDEFMEQINAQIVSGHVNDAGQLVLVQRDGTELNGGVVIKPDYREVKQYNYTNGTPNFTWTKPFGATRVRIIAFGAGAGQNNLGGAGKGGAVLDLTLSASLLAATETATPGKGGNGYQGGAIPQAATAGGNTLVTIGNQTFTIEGGDLATGKTAAEVLRGGTVISPSPYARNGGNTNGGAGNGGTPGNYGIRLAGEDGDPVNGIAGAGNGFPGGGGGGAGASGRDGCVVFVSYFTETR